jgi:hypothetical protein
MVSYAESRTNRWRNRNASSPGRVVRSDREQFGRNPPSPVLGKQIANGAHEELLADHGGRLEHLALFGRQAVEP